jgi:hypothetical protein
VWVWVLGLELELGLELVLVGEEALPLLPAAALAVLQPGPLLVQVQNFFAGPILQSVPEWHPRDSFPNFPPPPWICQ